MVKIAASIERYDRNGYPRGKLNHSDLLHRQIAYSEIYLKDKEKYPLPFSKYIVHHRDKDKENFNPENLQLLTREEHERLHNMPSRNQFLKQYYARKEREWKEKIDEQERRIQIEREREIEERAKKDRERFLKEMEQEKQDQLRREEMREQNKTEFEEKKRKRKWFFINLWRRKKGEIK